MVTFINNLYSIREDLVIRGFGLIAVIAGLSKFIALDVWAAVLPEWFFTILPIPGPIFGIMVAVLEAVGGLWLLFRIKFADIWAILAAIWLLKLMFLALLTGNWTIALRDLGLFIMAIFAFVVEIKKRLHLY